MHFIKKLIKKTLFLHEYAPHKEMGINYYFPSEDEFKSLRASLIENYFSKFPPPFPAHSKIEVDKGYIWMEDHLTIRLKNFRENYVPFLNSVKNLKGATVLDVGCGTGATLVALAEAGANVIGIDIDQGSINVAKKRCEIYGVKAEIFILPASEILKFKPEINFDFIIFNASLEHMLLDERLKSLKAAWDRLSVNNGYLGIIECPNRLWYFDHHTSELPFFDWLPNDLALQYTRFSPREYINRFYTLPDTNENMINFIRLGRGMSYHEIDLSIGQTNELNVMSSLEEYRLSKMNWLEKIRIKKKKNIPFQNFLKEKSERNLHKGFFESWLNIIIKK